MREVRSGGGGGGGAAAAVKELEVLHLVRHTCANNNNNKRLLDQKIRDVFYWRLAVVFLSKCQNVHSFFEQFLVVKDQHSTFNVYPLLSPERTN